MIKIEDQENRNRRKDLRIRGLPEMQGEGEDLQEKMDKIFGHMLSASEASSKINFERIHRVRKPAEMAGDVPRDVIARFYNFYDKEQIRTYVKTNQPIKYEETTLQIFPDLAAETLAKEEPLNLYLNSLNIQYFWGFPACLIGCKEGRSATLRFPEDTAKFCNQLDIPLVEIPGWWEKQENTDNRTTDLATSPENIMIRSEEETRPKGKGNKKPIIKTLGI